MQFLLLFSVFVIATCGLIYELVAGALASYLLGDSVTQFSIIIGVYLFSMGIGSFLSKYFEKNILGWFIQIEILVGFVGGISSSILFVLFEQVASFQFILYLLIAITGTLVGLEIPLMLRILKDKIEFKDLVSKVFTFDYIGALLASVIFPLILVPHLGLIRTSFFFGIMNVLVAFVLCVKLEKELHWAKYLKTLSVFVLVFLLCGFVFSSRILSFAESLTFADHVIYSKTSAYQRIVITRGSRDIRLYLNGNLQFSSADEYRYHEALIHPVMKGLSPAKTILVLGGGDGMAVRELLKYPSINSITLVDLDQEMTKMFTTNNLLLQLNQHALLNPKVKVINEDAFQWLKKSNSTFDRIIIDFPDPSNYALGKLYSTAFYQLVKQNLSDNGRVVVQSTSPLAAPNAYWCVAHTLEAVGFKTTPYHAYVPSFGEWGYVMTDFGYQDSAQANYPKGLRFLSPAVMQQMLNFPQDMEERKTDINKLNNQSLVNYFEKEWSRYE